MKYRLRTCGFLECSAISARRKAHRVSLKKSRNECSPREKSASIPPPPPPRRRHDYECADRGHESRNVADIATGLVSLAKLLVGDDLAMRTALARCMFETSRELVEAAEESASRTIQ